MCQLSSERTVRQLSSEVESPSLLLIHAGSMEPLPRPAGPKGEGPSGGLAPPGVGFAPAGGVQSIVMQFAPCTVTFVEPQSTRRLPAASAPPPQGAPALRFRRFPPPAGGAR